LKPEQSLNWSVGVDYTPANNFLRGLNIAATWYSIKITSLLANFNSATTSAFGNAAQGFTIVVPSDLRSGGTQLCPGMDSTPQLCAPFQDMIRNAIASPGNTVPPTAQTLIYWLNDGGVFNRGWQKNEGLDYSISYDWDMGDLGSFNVGTAG